MQHQYVCVRLSLYQMALQRSLAASALTDSKRRQFSVRRDGVVEETCVLLGSNDAVHVAHHSNSHLGISGMSVDARVRGEERVEEEEGARSSGYFTRK